MKPSVEQAVREAPISPEATNRWLNEELKPLLRQLRGVLNACAIERTTATSDGAGTYVRLWTSPAMPTDAAWSVSAIVTGTSSAAGGADKASFHVVAAFESTAGAVTQFGADVYLFADGPGTDARFGVDAGERVAYLEARDAAAGAMDFVAVTQTSEARL